jgi:hypothetical protein
VPNQPLFEVRDKDELSALLRTVIAAKFQEDPNVPEVPGSAFVADMAHRLADAVTEHDDQPGARARAEEWRKAERHSDVLDIVRRRIAACEPWSGWDAPERRRYVLLLLAPFRAEEKTIAELIREETSASALRMGQ